MSFNEPLLKSNNLPLTLPKNCFNIPTFKSGLDAEIQNSLGIRTRNLEYSIKSQ